MAFDERFLAERAKKQEEWSKKGIRTGSGKPFTPMVSNGGFVSSANGMSGGFGAEPGKKKQSGKSKGERPANPHAVSLAALARTPELRTGGVVNGRKLRANHEHWEQVLVFDWIFRTLNEYYDDFAAVPMGGLRSNKTANDIYAEGGKSGYPDITGDVPSGKYHGLFIELKYGSNGPSADQVRMMNRRRSRGYFVALCYGHEEAMAVITEYLALEAGGSMVWSKNEDKWAA